MPVVSVSSDAVGATEGDRVARVGMTEQAALTVTPMVQMRMRVERPQVFSD